MNSLEGKLEAMVVTKPDRKTKKGEKQANHHWYLRKVVQKAKYNAKYHAEHQYKVNHAKAVKRGHDGKHVKQLTVKKYDIKWNQATQKYH